MAGFRVAFVCMTFLLFIATVRSEPPQDLPQSDPSNHGLESQKGGSMTVSPAMLTFFKGTQSNVELPEAIDSATIARASRVPPMVDTASSTNMSGGAKKRKGAVVAGVVCGVAGLVLIVGAFVVYKRRNGLGVGETCSEFSEKRLGYP